MADDYDNTDEIANLTDGELKGLVRARLVEHNAIDPDDVTVSVRDGVVTVAGRVGTESEVRIVEHLLTDVVGIKEVDNQLVVDELRRAESPMDIHEHLASEDANAGLLLGDRPSSHNPEAEHLRTDDFELEEGTHDVNEATQNAEPWIPPESPTPEGISGTDAGLRSGEDH